MTHIGDIIAGMTEDVARQQARWLKHDQGCGFWNRIDPTSCSCSARSVVDLLLYIAARKAA
jgi:hypothetical protein